MISPKYLEKAIRETALDLRDIAVSSSMHGEDLKVTAEKTKKACYKLLEITLMFQGQEEAELSKYMDEVTKLKER